MTHRTQGFHLLEDKLIEAHHDGVVCLVEDLEKLNAITLPVQDRKSGKTIQKPAHFGDMMRYLLSVAHLFNMLDESSERTEGGASYALFGGYGVLSHLVARHGRNIIPHWRTSPDLDILAWNHIDAEAQLRGYFVTSKRASEKSANKVSFNIKDSSAQVPCEIDYYPAQDGAIYVGQSVITSRIHQRVVGLEVCGITVKTLAREDLLRLKLDVQGGLRPKDESDILDILSLYALDGYSSKDMVGVHGILFPNEQRKVAALLADRLENSTMILTYTDKPAQKKMEQFAQNFVKAFRDANPYEKR
jgi:hypothetical protein